MNKVRCPWCGNDPLYVDYHDREWGVPVHDDIRHFEFLLLESMQAGLSWITILRKREAFKNAFDSYDPLLVSTYDDKKKKYLMENSGIIRNRLKIEAAVNNASRFLEIQKEFGSFDKYIWSFTHQKPVVNSWKSLKEIPAKSTLSEKISVELKKRGFKFLGPVIIHSHLQATGIINDHLISCFRWKELKKSK